MDIVHLPLLKRRPDGLLLHALLLLTTLQKDIARRPGRLRGVSPSTPHLRPKVHDCVSLSILDVLRCRPAAILISGTQSSYVCASNQMRKKFLCLALSCEFHSCNVANECPPSEDIDKVQEPYSCSTLFERREKSSLILGLHL